MGITSDQERHKERRIKLPEKVLFIFLLPFIGTVAGAGLVYFVKSKMNSLLQGCMSGFAAGVMTAAAVWGLIIPAMERSIHLGSTANLPVVMGLWTGLAFLQAADFLLHTPRIRNSSLIRKIQANTDHATTILAISIHNIPEGMAVGAIVVGWLTDHESISSVSVFALSLGIALQNIPEGAIVSVSLRSDGMRRTRAFLMGVFSALLESAGTIVTMLMAGFITAALPFLLSFAAGAMLYVVVKELIPEMAESNRATSGTVSFGFGFTLMMLLDCAFG